MARNMEGPGRRKRLAGSGPIEETQQDLFSSPDPTNLVAATKAVADADSNSERFLPAVNAASLANKDVPRRQWIVENLIPAGNVSALAGAGGTGKSQIALQLAASVATGKPWLGYPVPQGKALFLTAEEEQNEIHRRLNNIVDAYGIQLGHLNQLEIVTLADEDALLVVPDTKGQRLVPTARFHQLENTIGVLRPVIVVLDTRADLFGANEIDRRFARQFIGMLRGLAIAYRTTVLLLDHPSLTGMSNGSAISGSTAWTNSVRSRLSLQNVKGDSDARLLRTVKANYGPVGEDIPLRWENGVITTCAPRGAGLSAAASQAHADLMFLDLLAVT